jgi:hypothetical protein
MYLKGSRLSLNKKRHKPNGLLVFFLVVGIGLLLTSTWWWCRL